MKFDYSKLEGLIVEHYKTKQNFSKQLGISNTTLVSKLSNRVPFNQYEIHKMVKMFKLTPEQTDLIFFTEQSRKTENMKGVK